MTVQFPEYRRYEAARIRASDGAMATLVALRISEVDLSKRDQDDFLPQLFSKVNGIERLTLKVGDARTVIGGAEKSLAFVTIPFVMSVYQSYATACLRMVAAAGDDSGGDDGSVVNLDELHDRLTEAGLELPTDLVELFDLIRMIRNRIVHFAGLRGSHITAKWRGLPGEVSEVWRKAAGRDLPGGPSSEELDLGTGELIGTLAVVTRLGRELNAALVKAVPSDRWATIVAQDFRVVCHRDFGRETNRSRKLKKFAEFHYRPIDFADGQLDQAVEDLLAELGL